MKIGLIGGGNMAEAILWAVFASKLAGADDISVSDISEERRSYLMGKYKVRVRADNAVEGQEVIVLAVKPQVLAEVMGDLRGRFSPSQLVISIVAGKNLAAIRNGLAHDCLVRSMPNTPAQIGQGMTVWTATPQVTAAQKTQAAAILGAMGLELYVEEEKYLDMATAVSGSGPAYLFFFAESMMTAARLWASVLKLPGN